MRHVVHVTVDAFPYTTEKGAMLLTSGTRCCSGQTLGRWAPAAAAAWQAARRPSVARVSEPAPALPCKLMTDIDAAIPIQVVIICMKAR